MSNGEPKAPTLVVNPADDGVFNAFAHILVDHGAVAIRELELRLRAVYPHAAVHARELAAEPVDKAAAERELTEEIQATG